MIVLVFLQYHRRFERVQLCSFPPRFTLDIKPSKEVSEYTATIAYKLLSEGKDGRQKVDSLQLALRAEGMNVLFGKKTFVMIEVFLCHNHLFNLIGLHT